MAFSMWLAGLQSRPPRMRQASTEGAGKVWPPLGSRLLATWPRGTFLIATLGLESQWRKGRKGHRLSSRSLCAISQKAKKQTNKTKHSTNCHQTDMSHLTSVEGISLSVVIIHRGLTVGPQLLGCWEKDRQHMAYF